MKTSAVLLAAGESTRAGTLKAISEEGEGMRAVLRAPADRINWVELDTPLARLDLNTPEAYRNACATFPDPRLEP